MAGVQEWNCQIDMECIVEASCVNWENSPLGGRDLSRFYVNVSYFSSFQIMICLHDYKSYEIETKLMAMSNRKMFCKISILLQI